MGVTFVEKGEGHVERGGPRAIVLAGGAISGGAFKLGGLIALNTFLRDHGVTDFDIYVGISAGSFLAAPMAAGIEPEELLLSIEGRSERIAPFTALHFYRPNWREFLGRPAKLARDAAGFAPALAAAVGRQLRDHRALLVDRARAFLRDPELETATRLIEPIAIDLAHHSDLRGGWSYLPSGVFDNRAIERFIRDNFRRNGVPNHFKLLELEYGKRLYIGATHLDTASPVVFGPDEDSSVTISEAVQASTAIPGFYRPARIGGEDYVDAGVRKTANISQAVKAGAQLIIAYNPFRPYVNYHADQLLHGQRSMSDMGIVAVVNQAFRTLLHTRLMLGIEKLRLDESFRGDVILLEPSETDAKFFHINPLAFWRRAEAAAHGFMSVKDAIERHHVRLVRVLSRHGIRTDRDALRARAEQMIGRETDPSALLDILGERRAPDPGRAWRPALRLVGAGG